MISYRFMNVLKILVLSATISVWFCSPGIAAVIKNVYAIYGGTTSEISQEIKNHIKKKKHFVYENDEEKGFYYYQPRHLWTHTEGNYIVTALKQIDNDIYIYVKHNYTSNRMKQLLLKHLKKKGFKTRKIKDDKFLASFDEYTDRIANSYKYSDFSTEEKSLENTAENKQVKQEVQATSTDKPAQTTKKVNLTRPSEPPKLKISKTSTEYKSPAPSYAQSSYNRLGNYREVSKSGQIFNKVKNGVVTIISAGHGSGFLVDKSGLIVTNYHVVKGVEDDLIVRFGRNQVVKGKVISTDPKNDIAIVWANLANIKNPKILEVFLPCDTEPLVVPGEKVMAIGSPLEWESMEKTLTEGVVSKSDKSVIFHDANIDPGNSGGPLINYGGYVVGVNTFGHYRTSGVFGSVPVTRALQALSEARNKVVQTQPPSPELIPDYPSIPYSFELMEKAYKNSSKKVRKREKEYTIDGKYFTVHIKTPPQLYRQIANKDERVMDKFEKRQGKYGSGASDSDYDSKGISYYNDQKPVVTVTVIPEPTLTPLSMCVNALSLSASITGAALTGAYMPLPTYSSYTFKRDFSKLYLVDGGTGKYLRPYVAGLQPYTVDVAKSYGANIQKFNDKTYVGVYEFDPRYFNTGQNLTFKVKYGDKDCLVAIKLKDKIKRYIIEDFEPYWQYVNQKQQL